MAVRTLANDNPRRLSAGQRRTAVERTWHLPAPPEPFGTYVEAVQTANLLFLSGMLPHGRPRGEINWARRRPGEKRPPGEGGLSLRGRLALSAERNADGHRLQCLARALVRVALFVIALRKRLALVDGDAARDHPPLIGNGLRDPIADEALAGLVLSGHA